MDALGASCGVTDMIAVSGKVLSSVNDGGTESTSHAGNVRVSATSARFSASIIGAFAAIGVTAPTVGAWTRAASHLS